jgi:hypothetical protein
MSALFPIRALFSHSCPHPRLGTIEDTTARMNNFPVASGNFHGYRSSVAAKSAADLGGSTSKGATAPPLRLQALFLCPHSRVMAGCAGAPSGASGSFTPIRQSCATRHPYLLGGRKEWLLSKGATPMTTLIPSKIRALAHRRMALSALRANSSLSVRLKRYNHHMDQVRALESQGGMQ